MRKKMYLAYAINILKMILWGAALMAVHIKVLYALEIYDVKEITESSYEAYRNNMQLMIGTAIGLTAVWWSISLIPLSGREIIENNAWICALISVLLYFGVSVWSFLCIPGVYREGGTLISLRYVFLYPCVYTAALYLASPNNICCILLPVKWHSWFLAALAVLILGVCVFI